MRISYVLFILPSLVLANPLAPEDAARSVNKRSGKSIFGNPIVEGHIESGNRASNLDVGIGHTSSAADIRMEELGLHIIHEERIGDIRWTTWEFNEAQMRRRSLGHDLEKRAMNIEGKKCSTRCGYLDTVRANTTHCDKLYKDLYTKAVQFRVKSQTVERWQFNECASFLVNLSPQDIVYDYWDMGGTSQWLNGACLIDNSATIGACLYEPFTAYDSGVYTSVNHPQYFGAADVIPQ